MWSNEDDCLVPLLREMENSSPRQIETAGAAKSDKTAFHYELDETVTKCSLRTERKFAVGSADTQKQSSEEYFLVGCDDR